MIINRSLCEIWRYDDIDEGMFSSSFTFQNPFFSLDFNISDFLLKYIILTVVSYISYIHRFLFSFLVCLLINKNYVLYWFNYIRVFIGI